MSRSSATSITPKSFLFAPTHRLLTMAPTTNQHSRPRKINGYRCRACRGAHARRKCQRFLRLWGGSALSSSTNTPQTALLGQILPQCHVTTPSTAFKSPNSSSRERHRRCRYAQRYRCRCPRPVVLVDPCCPVNRIHASLANARNRSITSVGDERVCTTNIAMLASLFDVDETVEKLSSISL